MKIEMEKYHGLGNDYLIYDPNKNNMKLGERQIRLLCSRNYGIGADGILIGPLLEKDRLYFKIFNSDGSEAKKAGNGSRIFAKYLKDQGYVQKNKCTLETADGCEHIQYLNEEGTRIKVSVGTASFWSDRVPMEGPKREVLDETLFFGNIPYRVTCLSLGNPHCVIWLNDISKELVCKIGKISETAEYFPEKVNTQLLRVIDRNHVEVEIYERGVGYTLASGSCGCAAAAAAFRMGLTDKNVSVHMPGGVLIAEVMEDGMIQMTGDVSYVGKIKLSQEIIHQMETFNMGTR